MKLTLNTLTILLLSSTWLSISNSQAATINGSIEFAHRFNSSLPVSGKVAILNVLPGQSMRKGDLLLRLDQVPFEASVTQATAQFTIKQADYQDAKRNLDHATELFDRGVLSTVELEIATLNEKRAGANQNSAKATLDQATYRLENSAIRAPFNGWVIGTHTEVGETVNNSLSTQTMLSLAEADWYDAIFTLGLTSVKLLKRSATIKVKVAGKRYSGIIVATSLEPTNASSGSKARYKIHIKFNSNGRLLRSGESASISLPN